MINLDHLHGQQAAVLGLGKSGISAANALLKSGVHVVAWDDKLESREKAKTFDIPIADLNVRNAWVNVDFLVLSPGIPHHFPKPHPAVKLAKKMGIPIISDIDLLFTACPEAFYIGITGTNGKSTTTALIHHILKDYLPRVEVGGNLGNPVLEFDPLNKGDYAVLELSSYQLDITPSLDLDIAVLLNITPDHINRHGSFKGYQHSKKRIFKAKTKKVTAVISVDDEPSLSIKKQLRRPTKVIPFSCEEQQNNGISILNGALVVEGKDIYDLRTLNNLKGKHNWQNIAAAYAVAKTIGIKSKDILHSIETFPGLAHRQEVVGQLAHITYVNDSKATNAEASAKALTSYENIYWLAGGQPKEGGVKSLIPLLETVQRAYLYGEAAEQFTTTLKKHLPCWQGKSMHDALQEATRDAIQSRKPAVVLLSPACASWDQFKSFEDRGDQFRDQVRHLIQQTSIEK